MNSSSSLCDSYIIPPVKVACSSHGYCSADGQCICDAGWSGRGEWVDRTGRDCNVNEAGVRIMHAFGIFMALCCWYVAIRANWRAIMMARSREHNASSVHHNHPSHNNSTHSNHHHHQHQHHRQFTITQRIITHIEWIWTAITNDSASSIGLYVWGYSPLCLVYHLVRISEGHGSEIFVNFGTAVCMLGASVFFWIGTAQYAWILIKHTTSSITHERGTAGAAATIARMRQLLLLGACIGGVSSIACLWSPLASSDDSRIAALVTFYWGVSLAGIWMFVTIAYHSWRAIKQIDALHDPKLAPTRKRLMIVTSFLTLTCNMGFTTTSMFAGWPFLHAQSAYLAPVVPIFGNIMSLIGRYIWNAETRDDAIHNNPISNRTAPVAVVVAATTLSPLAAIPFSSPAATPVGDTASSPLHHTNVVHTTTSKPITIRTGALSSNPSSIVNIVDTPNSSAAPLPTTSSLTPTRAHTYAWANTAAPTPTSLPIITTHTSLTH